LGTTGESGTSPEPLLVSVVIPTYNRADLLPRAVTSALAQCIRGDEVIVVDDGSTDNTEAALAPFRDRINYVRIPNGGVSRARNEGMRLARNPLIAFLDSDDEWMPGKLQLQRALLQARPDIQFCFSDTTCQFDSGEVLHHFLASHYKTSRFGECLIGPGVPFSSIAPLPQGIDDFLVHIGDLYTTLMDYVCVTSQTVVARREAVGERLRYPEDLSWREDWECFGRLARSGPVAYIDFDTSLVYRHGGKRLTFDANMLTWARNDVTILSRVWGSDPEFLSKHGERFEKKLRQRQLHLIRVLLRFGRTREARRELKHIQGSPLLYRMLAHLPGPLTRQLLAIRHAILSPNGQED
jgi:glycosyltransferase involved in cell wall biosynthesis